MIYVPLHEEWLNQHKVIAHKDGTLYKALKKIKLTYTDQVSTEILDFILTNLEQIVSCRFEEMQTVQQNYLEKMYKFETYFQLENDTPNEAALVTFYNMHKEISRKFLAAYKRFTSRSDDEWNSYKFLRELNQHVCPYCNANFIHTVQSENVLMTAGSRALADLDHFLPKSIFPIFAITLANLVPSCIYCNQRFKNDYYTSFARNFSPYDKNVEAKLKFKIAYDKNQYESVWDKLQQLPSNALSPNALSPNEQYYIQLVAYSNKAKIESYIEGCSSFIVQVQQDIDAIEQFTSGQQNLIRALIEEIEHYVDEVAQFISRPLHEIIVQKEAYVQKLVNLFEDFMLARGACKGLCQEERKKVTALKKIIEAHLSQTEKTLGVEAESKVNIDNDFKKVDFVDVTLGKSFNYQIEIEATGEKEDQYKVYNNAALFQLEAVYNEYRGYINRKIEQSYILNDLYKAQLHEQFPTLFPHTIDSMTDAFFTKKEDLRHEVLGKLVHDIVVPTVKAGRTELLDL